MNRNHDDRATLIDKLGKASEIKRTANDQMLILNLGVQVTSWATDEGGQRQTPERTSWHRVISFNPRVIRQARGLETDDIVVIRGYLEHRRYDKDGQSLFITEFVAEEFDSIRTKRLPSALPNLPPVTQRDAMGADLLQITIERLPGGRESGAVVISRRALPISNLADLVKAIGGLGD